MSGSKRQVHEKLPVGNAMGKAARTVIKDGTIHITGLKDSALLKHLAGQRDLEGLVLDSPEVAPFYWCKALASLPWLRHLTLVNCTQPPTVKALGVLSDGAPNLKSVSLQGVSELSDDWMGILSKQSITSLELCDIGNLTSRCLVRLGECGRRLRRLRISRVELTEQAFYILGRLTGLEELVLDAFSNNWYGSEFFNVGTLTGLRVLAMNHCPFSTLPGGIERLGELKELDVSNTGLDALGGETRLPAILQMLSRLRALNVSHTNLRELPLLGDNIAGQLEDLRISNTEICELPACYLADTLIKLDISHTKIRSLPSVTLPHLERLDMSYTACDCLPDWDSSGLRAVNISNTQIRDLPGWLGQRRDMRHLDLSQLKLTDYPDALLLRKQQYHDRMGPSDMMDCSLPERSKVYVGGTQIENMDMRLLTVNRPQFLLAYCRENSKRVSMHRGAVNFLGDMSEEYAKLACRLFDVTLEEFQDACGAAVLDAPDFMQTFLAEYGGDQGETSQDADIRVILYKRGTELELGHPLFMLDQSLYVAVLDGRRPETLNQRALYWAQVIESYAPNSRLIFVVEHGQGTETDFDITLLQNAVFMEMCTQVFRISDDQLEDIEEDRGTDSPLMGLRHEIARQVVRTISYSQPVPYNWWLAIQYAEQMVAARAMVSQAELIVALTQFFGFDEKIARVFLELMVPTYGRVAQFKNSKLKNGAGYYHVLWLEEGVYQLLRRARARSGMLGSAQEAWEWLIDESIHEYSLEQTGILLSYLEEESIMLRDSSGRYLCSAFIGQNWAGSEKMDYAKIESFINAPDVRHYVVQCPVISQTFLVRLLTRLVQTVIKERPKGRWRYGITAESACIIFNRDEESENRILVLGGVGTSSDLHIYYLSRRSYILGWMERWTTVQVFFEQLKELLSGLPPYLERRYRILVEVTEGNQHTPKYAQSALLSVHDILGFRRAGRADYYNGELNRTFEISALMKQYIGDTGLWRRK